ncbi:MULTISPECIES: hypothetical protein [Bacillaceae]|uniref:hypothetical protein n=1 Tax=Bacillaceae TaxID=186817 RepID=UPI00047B9092|nr:MULTISPECIES: hypothetical protein [Bacillaceae]UOE96227.1 hypothetical protein MM271_11750 [Alkalihalobacillus sp. LMS39]
MTTMAIHETVEVHELVTFKSLCLTKAATMQALVTDQELKNLMAQDIQMTTKHIQDLQHYLD